MAKPNADWINEKEDSWDGDGKAIKHPRDRVPDGFDFDGVYQRGGR